MDWSRIPPLASLRAFEAAARNLNYSAAGRELNVSHAAIAQQVRGLEGWLGFRLARRAGRGIELTAEGVYLAEHLVRGFGEIADGLRKLNDTEAARPVHVSMTPSFSMNWFLPRMQLFRVAHPDIDMVVNPTTAPVDFATSDCDVAIRFGRGGWDGLESELLLPSNFAIVAAPALVADNWNGEMEDLPRLPWLQELGTREVRHWLEGQGIEMPDTAHITDLPGYMMLAALRSGQGIAATARVFVDDDVETGRLVVLYEGEREPTAGYHLVWRKGVQRDAVRHFLRWIRREAEEDRREWSTQS